MGEFGGVGMKNLPGAALVILAQVQSSTGADPGAARNLTGSIAYQSYG